MDGGGAHGVWGTAEEAGLLQPQEEKATKVSNGSLLVPNRGNADGARLLVYVLNEGTRGHSHVTARQSLIRFKRKKGKLSDQALEGVNSRAWEISILGIFNTEQDKVLSNLIYLQDQLYFEQDVGPDDPQGSFSIKTNLWYFNSK